MSPEHQHVINTLAFWTGKLILDQDHPDQFFQHITSLQKDLAEHKRALTLRTINDDSDDEDLTSPLNYDGE